MSVEYNVIINARRYSVTGWRAFVVAACIAIPLVLLVLFVGALAAALLPVMLVFAVVTAVLCIPALLVVRLLGHERESGNPGD